MIFQETAKKYANSVINNRHQQRDAMQDHYYGMRMI